MVHFFSCLFSIHKEGEELEGVGSGKWVGSGKSMGTDQGTEAVIRI